MSPGFRLLDPPAEPVTVEVDGRPVPMDGARSLLANLLAAEAVTPPPFLCAIGHCQRCLVRVDGEPRLACRSYPRDGWRVALLPR